MADQPFAGTGAGDQGTLRKAWRSRVFTIKEVSGQSADSPPGTGCAADREEI